MTNLKKTLAVVLAFAMILSMGAVSTFAAYSDVTAGTVVSEAVDILSGLNILTGFEDGTFKPEETVTRAQMAAIICRTLGYEDQAQSSMGTTVFNDVAADHWASGYINVAQAQQIINGYGDGNYGPEDKVTYEQAVKMIVSALGYDLAASAKGGYPTGYLAIASAEGITKNANGKVGDAATRGTIAVLVYNSLEVRLMDQTSWSTGSDGDKYSKTDKTILTNYLEVVKVEGVVTDTPLTDVAGYTYDPNADAKIGFNGTDAYAWEFEYSSGNYTYKKVALGSSTILDGLTDFFAGDIDVSNLLGKYVVAYIGEDEATGNETVFAIAESKNKNEIIRISANQLVEDGQKYYNDAANSIGYTEVGSSRIKDVTLQKTATGGAYDVKVYANFDSKSTISDTSGLDSYITNGGIIELISNDADSEIEYILVTSYKDEAVIEAVEVNGAEYAFECYTGSIAKIDTEDEDAYVVVYKDGVLATVADLAANDTVSHVNVAKKFDVYYASSATVTGVVESYDPEEDLVTIAGTDYEISGVSGISANKLMGEEGTFFLNVDGQIAHNESAPTAVGKYALVTAVYKETSGVNSGLYAQVVLSDGTVAEYEISKTADVVDANKDSVLTDNTDVYFKGYFNALLTAEDGTLDSATSDETCKLKVANLKQATPTDLLVKLTISNNKITKATLLEGTPSYYASSAKYDADASTIKNKNVDDATVVFSVKSPEYPATEFVDPDDIEVGTIANYFVDGEDYANINIYDKDSNSDVYGALVGLDIKKAVDKLSSVFVVTSKRTTTYDDGDAFVVTGVQNGEEATYTIYNEDGYGSENPDALVAGDVLLLAEASSDGIVADYKQLVNFNKNYAGATTIATSNSLLSDDDDEIFSGYGYVTSGEKKSFAINGAITDDYDSSEEVALGNSIGYASAATYTLVDFSENSRNPEVTEESASKYLFDTEYETYAYVRYVNGKVADVVVYRMAEIDETLAARVEMTGLVDSGDPIKFGANVLGATLTVSGTGVTDNSDGTFEIAGSQGDEVTVTILVQKSGFADKTYTFDYEIK